MCGLLTEVAPLCCRAPALGARASVVVAHGLKLLHGMWDLPGPGLEPVSPALAGGFLTTVPPGKPQFASFTNVLKTPLFNPSIFVDNKYEISTEQIMKNEQGQKGNFCWR